MTQLHAHYRAEAAVRSVNAAWGYGHAGLLRDLEPAADGARLCFVAHLGLQAIDRSCPTPRQRPRAARVRRAVPGASALQLGPLFVGAFRRRKRAELDAEALPRRRRPAARALRRLHRVTLAPGPGCSTAPATPALAREIVDTQLRFLGPFAGRGVAQGIAGMPRACRRPPRRANPFLRRAGRSRSRAGGHQGAVGMLGDELLVGLRSVGGLRRTPVALFAAATGQARAAGLRRASRELRGDMVMIRVDDRFIVNARKLSGAAMRRRTQTPPVRSPGPVAYRHCRKHHHRGRCRHAGAADGVGSRAGQRPHRRHTLASASRRIGKATSLPARRYSPAGSRARSSSKTSSRSAPRAVIQGEIVAKILAIANGARIEGEVTVTSGKAILKFEEKRTSDAA